MPNIMTVTQAIPPIFWSHGPFMGLMPKSVKGNNSDSQILTEFYEKLIR